ncbi:membrane protein insertion efficiency factor YidD [Acidipila rosea]|uniref:Putative membrane protein insertion efficiency factor n=1 Tax=Acidipila rosea TaxID=768535 RepID=A0A4V6NET0_9BACT|nr:membrane protein insertion efficiency factor YidD [Acidipila rosea]MBW4026245.1 membrane protein insertion efficiency factor YidD [Acidobacteriota bacterium]MBW4044619.1 membrane protein insertion efficiency factor YidD [Acidobacteriota bacterium]TCK72791.1 hypothetical protein C7378_2381 [Acidipila rosea]
MRQILFRIYKQILSPMLHAGLGLTGACRFQPTCSEYASIAIAEHGFWRGSGLALWRLLRCQPFARGGFDPVPPRRNFHCDETVAGAVTIEPVQEPACSLPAGHR